MGDQNFLTQNMVTETSLTYGLQLYKKILTKQDQNLDQIKKVEKMGLEDEVIQKELHRAEKMDARVEKETRRNLDDLYKDTVGLLGSFGKKKGLATAALGVLMYMGPVAGPGKVAGEYLTGGEVGVVQAGQIKSLPDLSGAKYLGEKKIDQFKYINGAETTVKGYKKAGKIYSTFELKGGKVYAFMVKERKKPTKVFVDKDNDGNFETKSRITNLDREKYGI